MSTPLVSVLMPAYRAADTICDVVKDMIRQTLSDWELVIASDDGVDYRAILEGAGIFDKRIQHVSTGCVGGGAGAARNFCLKKARGRYIAPFDADDRCSPERLEILVRVAEKFGAAADNISVVDTSKDTELTTLLAASKYGMVQLGTRELLDISIPIMPMVAASLNLHWDPHKIILCDDVIFNLNVIDRLGALPIVNMVLHRYQVHGRNSSFGRNGARLVQEAYEHILKEIEQNGLGLKTIDRQVLTEGFRKRIMVNSIYAAQAQTNECLSFQEFMAARSNLYSIAST